MTGIDILKRVVSLAPPRLQSELKRIRYRRQIKSGQFGTAEPESHQLERWLKPGDWAIDVGANIGQYTMQFSDAVGPTGRVLAFEPMPETFAMLAASVREFRSQNVTLFNVALSDSTGLASMSVPRLPTGLKNFYQARIDDSAGTTSVLLMPLDALRIPTRVALIKIDAEGHDEQVLRGMVQTVTRFLPVLILETPTAWTRSWLDRLQYSAEVLAGSPNTVFSPPSIGRDNIGQSKLDPTSET